MLQVVGFVGNFVVVQFDSMCTLGLNAVKGETSGQLRDFYLTM